MVLIVAHRGAPEENVHENSVQAVTSAVKFGAHCIEVDVHGTKDGHIVMTHDHVIPLRGKGSSYIDNLSFEEVREFSGENGNRIQGLREVVEVIRGKKCLLKIDIKDLLIWEMVLDTIESSGIGEQVIITSPRLDVLSEIRRLSPTKDIVMEVGGFINPTSTALERMIATIHELNADIISPHYSIVTEELVQTAHQEKLLVHVWTVNSQQTAELMRTLEVDGVTTDNLYLFSGEVNPPQVVP